MMMVVKSSLTCAAKTLTGAHHSSVPVTTEDKGSTIVQVLVVCAVSTIRTFSIFKNPTETSHVIFMQLHFTPEDRVNLD